MTGAVAGDDGFAVECEGVVAGGDPVADGACPHDGGAFDEEDVAGEGGAVGGDVDEGVAAGVGEADFDQRDGFVADFAGHAAAEGGGGQFRGDAVEVEGAEAVHEVFAGRAHAGRGLHELSEQGGRLVLHALERAGGGDDLGAFDQFVAEAVVAVVVGVDQRPDPRRRLRCRVAHGAPDVRRSVRLDPGQIDNVETP